MTLYFDGLHRLHLGYDELGEYGSTNHVELMFDNSDTDQLAMFLYPRACAKVSRENLAITTQFFVDTKDAVLFLQKEENNGSTPSGGTTEDK